MRWLSESPLTPSLCRTRLLIPMHALATKRLSSVYHCLEGMHLTFTECRGHVSHGLGEGLLSSQLRYWYDTHRCLATPGTSRLRRIWPSSICGPYSSTQCFKGATLRLGK